MATEYTKAEATQDENQKYFILLILTDGDIDDFEKTKDEVVKASELPMSIIIIGVGDHEFSQMQV
jgi:Mg-chelatase subunit ChlD